MRADRELPVRHLVVSYSTYSEAERAVDSLAYDGFPVRGLSIVGQDLRPIANATGRRRDALAAVATALAGGVVGVLGALVLGLLNWVAPVSSDHALALYGFVLGAVIAVALKLLGHTTLGKRRLFQFTGSVAGSYELLADDLVDAQRAARVLEGRDLQGV